MKGIINRAGSGLPRGAKPSLGTRLIRHRLRNACLRAEENPRVLPERMENNPIHLPQMHEARTDPSTTSTYLECVPLDYDYEALKGC